jgi:Flp pilus assembly protein CpaB
MLGERLVSSRRTLVLIVALALGGLAAFGIYSYVGGLEEQAYGKAERVEVWVVTNPIAKGTSAEAALTQGMIGKKLVPVDVRPTTFISDPTVDLVGLVAVTDLPVNAIIVNGNFVAPSVATTGITNRLEEENLVTFTLSVDQVRGVAGMLSPGDDVNVIVTRSIEMRDGTSTVQGEDGAVSESQAAAFPSGVIEAGPGGVGVQIEGVPYTNVARMLYQKVKILAIGTQLAPDLGDREAESVNQVAALGLITLAVPPEAVLRLASVDPSAIYLSLVPKSYEPTPLLPIDPTEVLPGEDIARLTPYPATEPAAQ